MITTDKMFLIRNSKSFGEWLIYWYHKIIGYMQTVLIWVQYGEIQHLSNEYGVSLYAKTLFIEHVLHFPITHENEHRLYFLTRSGQSMT